MAFCSNCGARVSDNAHFCSECGYDIRANRVQSVSAQPVESDVEKIGALYELGRTDMEAQMENLLAYLR